MNNQEDNGIKENTSPQPAPDQQKTESEAVYPEQTAETPDPAQTQHICPFLGLKSDPKSWVGYPSPLNVCHRVKPLSVPEFNHQQTFCLSNDFINCSVYHNHPGQRMPKHIQSQSFKKFDLKKIILIEVLVGAVLIAVILGIIFRKEIASEFSEFTSLFAQKTATITNTPFVTRTSTATVSSSPTQTLTNSPSLTPTPILPSSTPAPPTRTLEPPILALETPIGEEWQYLIHAVVPGESLELYAKMYETSVDAIRAVNYDLPSFLPLDWVVVIPLGTENVEDMPAFETYQIRNDIRVEALALELEVDPIELRRYNLIPAGYTLSAGDWLIIPRMQDVP